MITFDFLWLFAVFILPFAWTPGPINITLAAAGTHRGYMASLPLIIGINTAFFLQAIGMGFGLGKLFELYPLSYVLLRYIGAIYIVYLAWKMLHLMLNAKETGMRFWHGFLLSMLNPKVYMTLIVMYAQFATLGQTPSGVLLLSMMSTATFFVGNSLWCLMGTTLRRYMESALFFRIYKLFVAALLVGVAVFLVLG